MHGILFKGLKEFVLEEYDRRTWNRILDRASVDRNVYLPIENYDDDELTALLKAAVTETGEPIDDLLEAYGRSVGILLLDTYNSVIRSDWSALDLVGQIENEVQPALEAQNPEMDLPRLTCRRVNRTTVVVRYRSRRQLCAAAKGILMAIGDYYDERLAISETRCRHDGADECEFSVKL